MKRLFLTLALLLAAAPSWAASITYTDKAAGGTFTHEDANEVKTVVNGKQDAMGEDDNYVTDAEKTVIGNTSGENTGDQTTVSGNAGTATALAANGTNCSAGEAPLGIDASGNAEGCWTPDSGAMTWPSTAGIPYWTTGTAWGGAYNATTKIPTDYVTNLSGTNTGDQDAAGVSITDSGGYFTGETVEAVTQELGAKLPTGENGEYGVWLTNNTTNPTTYSTGKWGYSVYNNAPYWCYNGTCTAIPTAGFANPMTTAGDMIKGGTSGAAARMVPGTGVVTALEANANGTGGFVTVGNAAGASAVLTGYSSGAGTVAGTDTVLQAIQKLNGNTAAKIGGSTGSTDNAILRADGTGGATAQATGVTIDDSDNVSTTGTLSGKTAIVVNSDTASYSVTTAQARANTIFLTTNTATTTYTLPAAEAGMAVCFKMGQGNSQVLRLDTDGTDYLVMSTGARTSAAGDYYGATASATNKICAFAYNTTDWYTEGGIGTWAEE